MSEDVLKMLRRVPSNTNMGTQRNIDFPTKNENSEKVDHPYRLFFTLFGSGFFKQLKYIFQNVAVNSVMAQTFPPGVTN